MCFNLHPRDFKLGCTVGATRGNTIAVQMSKFSREINFAENYLISYNEKKKKNLLCQRSRARLLLKVK